MSVPLTLGIITLGVNLVTSFPAVRSGLSLEGSGSSRSSCGGVFGEGTAAIFGTSCCQGIHHKDSEQKRDQIQACQGSQGA